MNYGAIIKQAWHITWKHKVLWIFGFFTSSGLSSTSSNSETYLRYMQDNFLLFAIGGIIGTVISNVSWISLVKGVQLSEKEENLSFKSLISDARPFFWRGLGFGLLLLLILLLALLLLWIWGRDLYLEGPGLLLLAFCLVVPGFLTLTASATYGRNALVIEDLGVLQAFFRGWDIFFSNIGKTIVIGLILFLIAFVVGLVAGIGSFVLSSSLFFSLSTVSLLNIVLIPISLLAGAIIGTFTNSLWILAYLDITKKPIEESPA